MRPAQNGSTGFRANDSKQVDWQTLDSNDANINEAEQQYREFVKEALWLKNSESFHSFVEEVQWYRAQ